MDVKITHMFSQINMRRTAELTVDELHLAGASGKIRYLLDGSMNEQIFVAAKSLLCAKHGFTRYLSKKDRKEKGKATPIILATKRCLQKKGLEKRDTAI
jgi:hypothetical protein